MFFFSCHSSRFCALRASRCSSHRTPPSNTNDHCVIQTLILCLIYLHVSVFAHPLLNSARRQSACAYFRRLSLLSHNNTTPTANSRRIGTINLVVTDDATGACGVQSFALLSFYFSSLSPTAPTITTKCSTASTKFAAATATAPYKRSK